jgi:hypothetical protein
VLHSAPQYFGKRRIGGTKHGPNCFGWGFSFFRLTPLAYLYYSLHPYNNVILAFREVKQFELWLNLYKKYKYSWYKCSATHEHYACLVWCLSWAPPDQSGVAQQPSFCFISSCVFCLGFFYVMSWNSSISIRFSTCLLMSYLRRW